MSRRSRKERRERQAQRALETNDVASLEKLADTSPERAANRLAAALREPAQGAAEDAPLEALAARLCGTLRRSGKVAAARELAAATAHRSARHRLELALAEIALGNDAAAEQAASADPTVGAIVAPLLAAVGVAPAGSAAPAPVPAPKKRGRPPGPAKLPAVAALHAVAAAAGHAVRGDKKAARDALKKVSRGLSGEVLADEMTAALAVDGSASPSRASVEADLLCNSSALVRSEAACESLVDTLARWSPTLARRAGAQLGMHPDKLRGFLARAAPRDSVPTRRPEEAARELARTAGADAFAPPHRGAAAIYEGFAWLASDPKRADRAFDRAVALGGDLVEALRGKMLAASPGKGMLCADCGKVHRGEGSPREAALAADRLARAVRRLPGGAPFAATASLLAVEHWRDEGDLRAALASLHAAREAGASGTRLDVHEAMLVGARDPARAATLLDAVIAKDPREVVPWRARMELARHAQGSKAEDDVLLRAAAATEDPELLARARTIRIQRGETEPFAGLVPGSTRPGALAAEAVPFVLARPQATLPPAAAACRAALAPMEQIAFDMALVAALVAAGRRTEGLARLSAAIDDRWGSPALLAKLAAATWLFQVADAIVPEARRRAARDGSGPALAALFGAAIAAEESDIARPLLTLGAAFWSRTEVKEKKAMLQRLERLETHFMFGVPGGPRMPAIAGCPDPAAVSREIDAILAPEHAIKYAAGEDLDGEDDDVPFQELAPFGPGGGEMVEIVARMLGLSFAKLDRLPPAKMAQVNEILAKLTRGAPTEARMAEAKRAILQIVGGGR